MFKISESVNKLDAVITMLKLWKLEATIIFLRLGAKTTRIVFSITVHNMSK